MTRAAAVRRRVLDWKFLAALAFLLMVAYLVIGGYTEQVAKGRRIDQLIQIGKDKDHDAEVARVAASRERDRLLANQRRLLRAIHAQDRRQAALARYLQDAGVTLNIPDSLITNKNRASPATPATPKTVRPKQKTSSPPPATTPHKPGPGGTSPPPGPVPPPENPNPVQDLLDELKGLIP